MTSQEANEVAYKKFKLNTWSPRRPCHLLVFLFLAEPHKHPKILPHCLASLLALPTHHSSFHDSAKVIEQLKARSGTDLKMAKLVMSSPNHLTSDIEDAFSSNFPDFIPASPDYVPALSGKTYSSSSNSFGVVPMALPTLLLFYDDPYMKVMQAFYA
ncbi:hypothetical protein Tco_0983775 [Tanacetum coccineum]